ncbi:hypothetical protein BGW36DRAFT_195364 [Talaromyces proteolyticus]|uniref:Uncharacterized protein n=1 Tax=Talaromyces proteolyticus TaxID=1131652 RepID=A0AAD4PYP0_9EURO|nr:uncharacterized protein BGW36DRAFT_195364 [Talaromyces proteolyticus]KAH8695007.1 hypothetical protein BGW36DRAFT_195364 [Talaromyces proteolyticus]
MLGDLCSIRIHIPFHFTVSNILSGAYWGWKMVIYPLFNFFLFRVLIRALFEYAIFLREAV